MTATQAMEMVFNKNMNRPMHVKEITKALLDGGWITRAEKPIFSITGAIIRDLDIKFERVKGQPNTFRLKMKDGAGLQT